MSSRLPGVRRALAALLALLAPAPLALAQYAPAARFDRALVSVHTSAAVNRVVGWEFEAGASFQATALGVYDCELSLAPQGGLARAKQVGLWSSAQTLLASATVPAGQGGQLQQDGFRYVAIPPTTLQAGQRYVVGAFWQEDDGTGSFDDYPDLQNSSAPVAFDPRVLFVQPRYRLFTSGLAFPDASLPGFRSFLGAVNLRVGSGAPDANPPADLTTTFASNNGFAGAMFDLRATHPQGLTVDAFQLNLGDVAPQSTPIEVSVYWRAGSYTAATDSASGWHHLGTTEVLSWGTNQPTPLPIGGLELPFGQTVGVYVFLTDYTQHPPSALVPLLHYTSIGPAAASYADANLALTGGVGKGAPAFTGPTYGLRMWNGGVLYSLGASAISSYCAGDGSGAPCPCGNEGAAGAGCGNSQGAGAVLSAVGGASVAAGGPQLRGEGLAPRQTALFVQGDQDTAGGAGAPFGDGLRCAGGMLVRLETTLSDVGGAASTSVDVPAAGGAQPGEEKRYQIWYRDPLGGPCGSGFNTSQGLAISWLP